MALTTCKLSWLCTLLHGLAVPLSTPSSNNQVALHIAQNLVFHERSKHIEIDCHLVRERVQQGLLQLHHIASADHLAHLFTKALGVEQFRIGGSISEHHGMITPYTATRGVIELSRAMFCNVWAQLDQKSGSSSSARATELFLELSSNIIPLAPARLIIAQNHVAPMCSSEKELLFAQIGCHLKKFFLICRCGTKVKKGKERAEYSP